MTISEKELEDMIFNADNEQLGHRGLWLPKNLRRQVRIGNYGIADIVGMERPYVENETKIPAEICIVELKKDEINIDTFIQAVRYAKGILRYFEYKKYLKPNIKIKLIGSSIQEGNGFIYLPDLINEESFSVQLYTYKLFFDGIYFRKYLNYCLNGEGFNLKTKNNNYEGF